MKILTRLRILLDSCKSGILTKKKKTNPQKTRYQSGDLKLNLGVKQSGESYLRSSLILAALPRLVRR